MKKAARVVEVQVCTARGRAMTERGGRGGKVNRQPREVHWLDAKSRIHAANSDTTWVA